MLGVFGFIRGLFDIIVSLIDMTFVIIKDTLYIIGITREYYHNIPNYFAWMPSPFITLICTIFSVVIIYKILGREG